MKLVELIFIGILIIMKRESYYRWGEEKEREEEDKKKRLERNRVETEEGGWRWWRWRRWCGRERLVREEVVEVEAAICITMMMTIYAYKLLHLRTQPLDFSFRFFFLLLRNVCMRSSQCTYNSLVGVYIRKVTKLVKCTFLML